MKRSILASAVLFTLLAAGCASEGDRTRQAEPASAQESTGVVASAVAPSRASAALGAPKMFSTHAAAAQASLTTLAHLAIADKTLGFHSPDEAASASLGAPLPMLMVGLNPLRAYHAGDDPRPLLLSEGSVLYPVTVNGDVRSSVLIRKDASGDWKASQFGRPTLASLATEGRTNVSRARGVAASGLSLVEIPTLAARMLAHEENGVPMLTCLGDVRGTDLHAGETRPAADVFARLQPIAAQVPEMRPN
jgi:hypothetical protein